MAALSLASVLVTQHSQETLDAVIGTFDTYPGESGPNMHSLDENNFQDVSGTNRFLLYLCSIQKDIQQLNHSASTFP
jgi:hypothetical protein